MFWRRKKADPPTVGCFGKLPATGDFVRHHASTEEMLAFDRWLEASIDHARRTLGDGFAGAYAGKHGVFIFHAEGKSGEPPARALAGAWAASGDSAGRSFPMMVYASYDYAQLAALGGAAPFALEPLFAELADVATNARSLAAPAFVERVSRVVAPPVGEPAAAEPYATWLAQRTVGGFFDATCGDPDARFAVVRALLEIVEPFRGKELPATGLAARVPLGRDGGRHAAPWMDLVRRLGRWQKTVINAFWGDGAPGGEANALLLHVGAPHVATFRELIAPAPADHVVDLPDARGATDADRRKLPADVERALADPNAPLGAVLERLT